MAKSSGFEALAPLAVAVLAVYWLDKGETKRTEMKCSTALQMTEAEATAIKHCADKGTTQIPAFSPKPLSPVIGVGGFTMNG